MLGAISLCILILLFFPYRVRWKYDFWTQIVCKWWLEGMLKSDETYPSEFWYEVRGQNWNWVRHGKYWEWDKEGRLLTKGMYRNGLRHGEWCHYNYDDGRIRTEEYQNDCLHGKEIQITREGAKIYEIDHRHGKRHGPSMSWHPNGNIRYKAEYRDDEIVPETRYFYDEMGKPLHGKDFSYHEGGKAIFMEREFFDGRRHGDWKTWSESGDLLTHDVYELGRIVKQWTRKNN